MVLLLNEWLKKVGILSTFFIVFQSYAQHYALKTFSLSEGLPQSQVYGFYQGKDGYLWVGTKGGGISKFDGKTFEPLFDDKKIQFINKIIPAQNKIYIAHAAGYCYYDLKEKKIIIPDNSINQHQEPVSNIEIIDSDSLFICTTKGVYLGRNNQFIKLDYEVNDDDAVIACSYFDGTKILAGNNYGLFKVVKNNNSKISLEKQKSKNGQMSSSIRSIINWNNATYVFTFGNGAYLLSEKKNLNALRKIISINEKIQTTYIDSKNNLWIGTNNNGVFKIDSNESLSLHFTEEKGLCRNNIVSIYEDDWGNMWFGSSGGGFSKYSGALFTNYNSKTGLPCKNVYACIQLPDSTIWIGSSAKGILKLKNETIEQFDAHNGFTNEKVKTIFFDNQNNTLYIGTEGAGLWTYDFKTFEHPQELNTLTGKWIKHISGNISKNLIVSTASNGVIIFNRLQHLVTLNKKNKLITNRINAAVEFENKLYIGTEGAGMYIYNLENYSINHLTVKDKLPGNTIRCLLVDDKNRIWVGCPNGIGYITTEGFPECHSIKLKNSYSNIYLLFKNNGSIYSGSAQGISKIKISENSKISKIHYFGFNEGLEGIECSQNAVSRGIDNGFLIGTINGFSIMRPEFERINYVAPYLNFTEINLFYENILGGNVLPKNIEFTYNQNHIGFKFKAINLFEPNGIRYQWRLAGLEDKWSPYTSNNEVNYANLAPENYEFKVRAINENGYNGNKILSFKFKITNAWYKEKLFYWSIGIIFFTLLLLSYFIVVKISKKKQLAFRQKLLNENRILELQQMALRLQMNPHFIFNCLNSIQNLVNQNRNEDANFYIREFSGLMRGMVDLTPKETIRLDQEINLLKNYLELEKLNRSNTFDYQLEVVLSDSADFYKIPTLLLQPFAENAIVHGFKGINYSGELNIKVNDYNTGLKIQISDNGCGLKNNESNIRGSAIRITKSRLELYNGGIGNSITINDNENENGVTVTIILAKS